MALLFAQKPELVVGRAGLNPCCSNCASDSEAGCVSYAEAAGSVPVWIWVSACGFVAENGGVCHDAGEESGGAADGAGDETGAFSTTVASCTLVRAGIASPPEPAGATGFPHELQNLTPGFNCAPQYRHSELDRTAGSAGLASGVAHFEQNLVPGRTLAPHVGQTLAGSALLAGRDTAEPHHR